MPRNTPHILRNFDDAIQALRNDVLAMAAVTRFNLEAAIQAVLNRQVESANFVTSKPEEIDGLQRAIERLSMDILARFRPVANDLRLVVGSMKIAIHLELAADHAADIANRAKKLIGQPEQPEAHRIEPIYTHADQLLRNAIAAYSDQNSAFGASLAGKEPELRQLHLQATGYFTRSIHSASGSGEGCLHFILIIHSLARIAEIAVKIGEDVDYLLPSRKHHS